MSHESGQYFNNIYSLKFLMVSRTILSGVDGLKFLPQLCSNLGEKKNKN